MGWDFGALGSGLANLATGGIVNTVTNAVQKVQEGKPLDAVAGAIVGIPAGAIVGAGEAAAAVASGVTGNDAYVKAAQDVQAKLNTTAGALEFAAAAITVGGALGGGSSPFPKNQTAKPQSIQQAAPAQSVIAPSAAFIRPLKVNAPPGAKPPAPSTHSPALMLAGGAAAIAVVAFLLFRK